MPNNYPEWRSFQFAHFLRELHLSLDMHYFINLTLKRLHLRPRNVQFGFYLRRWRRKVWRKMTSKLRPSVMHESSYIPCVRRDFLALISDAEFPVVYARKFHYWVTEACRAIPEWRYSVCSKLPLSWIHFLAYPPLAKLGSCVDTLLWLNLDRVLILSFG